MVCSEEEHVTLQSHLEKQIQLGNLERGRLTRLPCPSPGSELWLRPRPLAPAQSSATCQQVKAQTYSAWAEGSRCTEHLCGVTFRGSR